MMFGDSTWSVRYGIRLAVCRENSRDLEAMVQVWMLEESNARKVHEWKSIVCVC